MVLTEMPAGQDDAMPPTTAPGRISRAAPVLEVRDLVTMVAGLPTMLALSWAVPERAWEPIARAAARAYLLRRSTWHARQQAHLRRYVGERLGAEGVSGVIEGLMANLRLAQLQTLRCYHPGGWQPRLRLEGQAHLDAALACGRGAILWVAPFVFGPLVTKMALHGAGHRVAHLSRFTHGYSKSVWGARLINRVRTAAEKRYLAERLTIGADGATAGPMRALAARLRANGIVSISVGADGVQTVTVPFLDGEARLATGAITLARRMGAPLLPVFTIRQPDGAFAVMLDEPLSLAPEGPRAEAVAATARGFAARLEPPALGWPDQLVWHYDILRLAADAAGDGRA